MTNEEFERRAVRHGEVLLKPIDELPEGAKEIYAGNKYIVAESETHHHHVAVGDVRVFEWNNRRFLEAVKDSRIEHVKTFEKHETKPLFKGFFEIKIKKAYDYFKKRLEAVRD